MDERSSEREGSKPRPRERQGLVSVAGEGRTQRAGMAYLSLTLGNDLAAIGWGCATLWAVVCWGLLVEGG